MPSTPVSSSRPSGHRLPVSDVESPKLNMALYLRSSAAAVAQAAAASVAIRRQQHDKTDGIPLLMTIDLPASSYHLAFLRAGVYVQTG